MSSSCEGVPPLPAGGTFTGWDYFVFAIILAISAAIGLYYACSGGKQKTTAELILANKSMSALPVAISLFASYISTATTLGMPAEIFSQGTMYWMCVWGVMCSPIVGAFIFGPFFHRLKILSVYEVMTVIFVVNVSQHILIATSRKKEFIFCAKCLAYAKTHRANYEPSPRWFSLSLLLSPALFVSPLIALSFPPQLCNSCWKSTSTSHLKLFDR